MNKVKSGTISILGKPNTGKSTLINALTGRKISAVSDKPNTTRNKILGVLNSKEYQILFLDTPGIHKSNKFLNRIMVQSSIQAITESDISMVLIDGSKSITENDYEVINKVKDKKSFVVINKIDLIKKSKILKIVDSLKSRFLFIDNFLPISALEQEGLELLIDEIVKMLPSQEKILPDDYITDQPEKFYLSEIIREKIFNNYYEEVPYRTAVVVESIEDKKKVTKVNAYIIVENVHHKQIILGKAGSMIKKIGIELNNTIILQFKSGIRLEGIIKHIYRHKGMISIITFMDCKVSIGDKILFDPSWGNFDLICGHKILSVYGGPGDWPLYRPFMNTELPSKSIPGHIKKISSNKSELIDLYTEVRSIRENKKESSVTLIEIYNSLCSKNSDYWLLKMEILESSRMLNQQDLADRIINDLHSLCNKNSDIKDSIDRGISLIEAFYRT